MTTDDHPEHPAVVTHITSGRHVREQFGNAAVASLRWWPELTTISRLDGPSTTLTALRCGHVGVISPAAAEQKWKAELMDILDQKDTPPRRRVRRNETARELLDLLLDAAKAGEDVDPTALAAAREEVEIERLAAEGKAERDAQTKAARDAAARKALCTPVNVELDASEAALQVKLRAAIHALDALCEAVDVHNALAAAGAAKTGGTITSERYTSTATIGDARHRYWFPQTWLLSALHGVSGRWPLNKVHRIELPRAIPDGPRP